MINNKIYLAIKIAEFSAKEKKITPKNFNGIRGVMVEFHGIKEIQGKRKILQLEVSENENEFFDDINNHSLLRKARDHHEPILLEFQEIDYNEESQVATLKEVKIFRELESWFPNSQPEAEKINLLISEPKKQSEIIAEKKKSYENFQQEKAEFLWSLSNEKLCAETGFTKEGLGDTDILHPNGAALRNYLYRQKIITERSESHQTFITSSKNYETFEQRKKFLVKLIVSKFVLDEITWKIADDEKTEKFSGYKLNKANHRGVKNCLTENEREKIVESEEFSKLEIEELWEFQKFLSFLNALYELAKKEKRKKFFNNYFESYETEKKRRWKEFHNLIDKELDGLATKLTTDLESASQYIKSIENISESSEKEKSEKIKKLDLFIEEVNKLVELDIKQTEDIGIIEKVSEDSVKIKIVILEDDKEYFPLAVEKIKEEIVKGLEKIDKKTILKYDYNTKISEENDLENLLNIVKEIKDLNKKNNMKNKGKNEEVKNSPKEELLWNKLFTEIKEFHLRKINGDCQEYSFSFKHLSKIGGEDYREYWDKVTEKLIDYQSEEIEDIICSLLINKDLDERKVTLVSDELTRLKEKSIEERIQIHQRTKKAWKEAYKNNPKQAQKAFKNGWTQLKYSLNDKRLVGIFSDEFSDEKEEEIVVRGGEIERGFTSIKVYEVDINLLKETVLKLRSGFAKEENKKLFEKDDFIEIEKDELAPLIKQAQKENDSVKLAKLINDIKTYHNKPIYLDYSQKINDLVNKQIDLSNQETSVLLTNLKKLNIKLIEKELKALDKSKDLSNLITKLAPENQNFVNEINLAGEQDQIETIKNRVSTDIAKVKATIAKEKKNLLKNNNDSLTKNLLYGSLFAIIVLLVCYLVVKIVKKPSWRK
ncbi:hypothetical protein [endosymbiont GvMRE of Glomus versiforme]|uniref:hypothetical protein n=1 Tax=endosymbiont GvMRE of Glomus versiforme TaxID=2039283 RepID=UPI000EC2EE9B|nr:hypothetical protein [endosymbiont GvMRE of Glomus versiforme]RHZ35621.1 hypothetical protein GvMRE_IIg250 [endosymbiont GvMRE of Glomus versiforme]